MDVEQEEPEEDDDMETEYGSLDLVNEDFTVFEELNPQEYDDYRFILLSESRGVEHYIVRKLAWLRSLPVTRDVWIGIHAGALLDAQVHSAGGNRNAQARN